MSFNSDDSKEYSGAKEVDKLPEICVIGNANKYLSASLGVLSCIDPNSLRKISTYIACGSSSIIAVLLALSIPISSIREILMTTTIVDNIYNHIPTKRKTTGLMSIFSANDNKSILLLEDLKLWFVMI